MDSRWTASASSSSTAEQEHGRERGQSHPRERFVADLVGELERPPLSSPRPPRAARAGTARRRGFPVSHPSCAPRAGPLRELEPLAQDRLGARVVGGEIGEDRRQVVAAAHQVRELADLLRQSVGLLDRLERFGRTTRLREAHGERLHGLRVNERGRRRARPSRPRVAAAARPPRSAPAATGTSRAGAGHRRAPRARRAARASRPPSARPASASSSRPCISSGMTRRAYDHPTPIGSPSAS